MPWTQDTSWQRIYCMHDTWPNPIIGANAGGSPRLPMRSRWAARVAQFWRWAQQDGMRILHCITVLTAFVAAGCSQPVTALGEQDYHAITNVIRGDTAEAILDIRLVRGSVIVDTGRERVVDHCYKLERTRRGWRIVWKGT